MLLQHDIQWVAPAPLWDRRLENGGTEPLQRPARFHFQRDGYVEELGQRLQAGATAVEEGVLTNQLWKEKDLPGGVSPDPPQRFPKLYQPMHERYYTVSASLVCRRQGLPDRSVAKVDEETVSVVLRRLVPRSDEQEVDPDKSDSYDVYGWMGGHWRRLADMKTVDRSTRNEEKEFEEKRYPMFPTSYVPDDPLEQSPNERRVWNALIPTTEREDFLSAQVLAEGDSLEEDENWVPPRNENAVFRARCVYERPRCDPYFEPVVSAPTEAFRFASVMDPMAPARDHQFAMPNVGGAEDLKETPEAVSVVLGEKISQQVQRLKEVSMTDLNEEEVPDQQATVATVCRLSLPIITICALILLLVMVNVLNFIFQWVPYFMTCFSVPSGGDS